MHLFVCLQYIFLYSYLFILSHFSSSSFCCVTQLFSVASCVSSKKTKINPSFIQLCLLFSLVYTPPEAPLLNQNNLHEIIITTIVACVLLPIWLVFTMKKLEHQKPCLVSLQAVKCIFKTSVQYTNHYNIPRAILEDYRDQ